MALPSGKEANKIAVKARPKIDENVIGSQLWVFQGQKSKEEIILPSRLENLRVFIDSMPCSESY